MKYSQIREIKEFCDGLFSTPAWREVVENIAAGETDFEVDNVRFITSDTIDSVLAGELENDEYVLGCFNANFLADVTGWPIALIQAAQKGEAYSAIGEAIISDGHTEELAKKYASADGYGHHFNSYDFSEEEIDIIASDGVKISFHVFDNH